MWVVKWDILFRIDQKCGTSHWIGADSMVGGHCRMSQMCNLRRVSWAWSTSEYAGFFNEWPGSETSAVIHGQVVNLGIRGGINDGVEILPRPYSRPKSVMPAAMVEPHWVIIQIFLTIVIPT